MSTRIGAFLIAGVVFGGCGTDTGAPEPNSPPDTRISSVPTAGDEFSVHHILREPHTIEYVGNDLDGTVSSYEYLVHTHPRSIASANEIVVLTPPDDDPRWVSTGLSRVDVTLLADTLRADPRRDIGDGIYDRWHTFFVRAVDNEGAKDPNPAFRILRAHTTGPQMRLGAPVVMGQATELPVTFAVPWSGLDDGDNNSTRNPLEVRWVLVPAELNASDQPVGFPEALYDVPEYAWSEWFAYTEDLESTGRMAPFIDTITARQDSNFVFAVQGRDDGGAVTPQFKVDEPFANNMAVLKVRSSIRPGPWLTLHTDPDLGSYPYEGIGSDAQEASAAGASHVAVTWDVMITAHYGGRPGEYRWGWNVESEGDWSDWSRSRSAPTFTLIDTNEKFEVQARDSLGQITTATLWFRK